MISKCTNKRMFYIQQLKTQIKQFIYKHKKKYQQNAINLIIQKNQIKLDCKTSSFMFEGKLYADGDLSLFDKKDTNRILDPSFQKEVYELIHPDTFDTRKAEIQIDNYLGIILSSVQHVQDLKELLPATIHNFLNDIDESIFNIDNALSEQKIQTIKTSNQLGFEAINKLFVTQLLTKE